jgi:hypothetical protein
LTTSWSGFVLDPLVVLDRPLGEDELVSEPMPDQDLPAVPLEGAEVGVVGGDRIGELRHRLLEVPAELLIGERLPVEAGVLGQPVLQPSDRDRERVKVARRRVLDQLMAGEPDTMPL